MAEPFLLLTALTSAQRAQALERFTIIRPALEEGVSRAQVARTSQIAPSTVQLWIKRYREKGLAGLANNVTRSDKGKPRTLPETAIQLIEGLALALRQAIWRKEDSHWHICGIPSVFYTDHDSDFTSKHIEQVAADLGIELIFSEKGVPRGRGKIERFFRSVNEGACLSDRVLYRSGSRD
jgi:transposase InsO family protein